MTVSPRPFQNLFFVLALFFITAAFLFQNCGPASMGTMGGGGSSNVTLGGTPTPTITPIGSRQKQVVLTSGNAWSVPAGVTRLDVVECWGGGGGTRTDPTGQSYGGAGGGAYARISNFSITPGATVNYAVGAGGISSTVGDGTGGGDTWFMSSTTVLAKGGLGGNSSFSGSAGGSASLSIGEVIFAGGAGGDARGYGGAGGGGAASSVAPGIKGGNSIPSSVDGAPGGSSPAAGAGGSGSLGALTPANAMPGTANPYGGGGGGGGGAQNAGQTVPTGSPAGGGGAGGFPGGGAGSTGALTGSATGTGNRAGNGAGGQIVITYTE